MRPVVATLIVSLLGIYGCRQRLEPTSSEKSTAVSGSTLPAPSPSSKTVLDHDQVEYLVQAMLEAHDAFYESGTGYLQTPGPKVPPESEIFASISAGLSTGRWSTLMAVYYGLFPTYSAGYFPAIRECFSYLVSPNTSNAIAGKKPNYPEAYDYCVFMPIDRKGVTETGDLYNWATILKDAPALIEDNKTKDHAVGPMAWIHQNQEDAFKFIMFGGLCGIDTASQQAVLDEFVKKLPSSSEVVARGLPNANACP